MMEATRLAALSAAIDGLDRPLDVWRDVLPQVQRQFPDLRGDDVAAALDFQLGVSDFDWGKHRFGA